MIDGNLAVMKEGLSRREFLKLTSAGAVALMLPWALEGCGGEDGEARFFTPHERATVEAATARILPSDQDSGAREAGVVQYIENLLTALDGDPPLIFAGGPFSGRQPFPDNQTGLPASDVPVNSFRHFLPLSRVKEIGWRVRLLGSQSVPGGDFNDAVLGSVPGLRDSYRQGIRGLDATSQELLGANFIDLAPEDQDRVLAEGDQEFVRQLVEHTVEGMYAPPEYGGNKDLVGWKSINFEGDSQPLGYAIFAQSTGTYNQIPGKPVSVADPGEGVRGFDEETLNFVSAIVAGAGGKRFF